MATLLAANASFAQTGGSESQDVAAIKTVMESMATLADRNEYDALENLFADEVEVDYTSLGGGEVEVKSGQALMTGWASLLPGFERTRHVLTDLAVSVDGDAATASSKVTADHWVDGLFWSVSGTYDFAMIRDDGQWRITMLRLNFESETGTRDVFGAAVKRAGENPSPYLVRQKTRQTVMSFLDSLAAKDMDAFASLWAEDAVADEPFAPESASRRIVGKTAIVELFSAWAENTGTADFSSRLAIHPMLDPEQAFVEFDGAMEVAAAGGSYEQTYAALFHVTDGEISLYRVYYDPVEYMKAFPSK